MISTNIQKNFVLQVVPGYKRNNLSEISIISIFEMFISIRYKTM